MRKKLIYFWHGLERYTWRMPIRSNCEYATISFIKRDAASHTIKLVINGIYLCDKGEGLGMAKFANFNRRKKFFDLSNHLGNVLATVSDAKRGVSGDGSLVDRYESDVVSASDYYPFGMLQPDRSWDGGKYRYGFNGQERSKELGDNNYTAQFWEYDGRTGGRWNLDPKPTVGISEYSAFHNNAVKYADPLGNTLMPLTTWGLRVMAR